MVSIALVLWANGKLKYFEGIVYIMFHRHTEDGIGPVTSGVGLNAAVFGIVFFVLLAVCTVTIVAVTRLWIAAR